MLQFFRNMFSSTLGVAVTMGLLIVIALAFAAGDVASNGGFDGIVGGDRVAMVGKQRIGTAELSRMAGLALDSARADSPKLTMKDFLAQGGMDGALSQLIDRTAITVFGENNGIVAGSRLIGSELAKIPSLQGPDGKFSDAAYRQLLAQRHLSDEDVRQDIAGGLVSREVLQPAGLGAVEPADAVPRYAALLKEHRSGAIAILPSTAFAPKTPPTPAEIAGFYTANRAAFMRPERRVIRYATFDDSVVKIGTPPTEAQIAARYKANATQYAASQSRRITQLIVADEAGAKAVTTELAAGKSLEAAATERGLSAAPLAAMTHDALAVQSSSAVADAAFAAKRGAVAGPVRGGLGWYLLRIDGIEDKAARSLEQVHGEIAAALLAEQRKAELADLTARTEDTLDKGGALSDAAKTLGVTLQQTPPLLAGGQVFGAAGQTAPKDLARVVPAAFQMERENQPQLAEIDPGKKFVIFDVTQITPAAPAPLSEIGVEVATALTLQKGAAAARIAALKALAAVKHGASLAAATAALGVPLPPIEPVAMGREQLAAMQGKVPAPVALLFGMAPGTTKLLPAGGNRGWLMVQLARIEPGAVAANDPLLADTAKELGQLTGREYAEELRGAIRKQVGVTRNPVAIAAVARQLAGN